MHNFTPISALLGGVLIGLASVWLLAANGRIAGISGIVHGIFAPPQGWRDARAGPHEARWQAWFVSGLLVAGLAWQASGAPVPLREGFPLGWAAAAGLMVGFGTRMGAGCTSGHGVCGLGRLSVRSLVAVATFMVTGAIATYVTRHLLGVPS